MLKSQINDTNDEAEIIKVLLEKADIGQLNGSLFFYSNLRKCYDDTPKLFLRKVYEYYHKHPVKSSPSAATDDDDEVPVLKDIPSINILQHIISIEDTVEIANEIENDLEQPFKRELINSEYVRFMNKLRKLENVPYVLNLKRKREDDSKTYTQRLQHPITVTMNRFHPFSLTQSSLKVSNIVIMKNQKPNIISIAYLNVKIDPNGIKEIEMGSDDDYSSSDDENNQENVTVKFKRIVEYNKRMLMMKIRSKRRPIECTMNQDRQLIIELKDKFSNLEESRVNPCNCNKSKNTKRKVNDYRNSKELSGNLVTSDNELKNILASTNLHT